MIDIEKFYQQLVDGYRANYDIADYIEGEIFAAEGSKTFKSSNRPAEAPTELAALAHMHVEESQCVVFEEFKMWKANADEYVYIYCIPYLTAEKARSFLEFTEKDGEPRIDLEHVSLKQQHMCTHLVCLVLCQGADEEAKRIIKKCRIYRNYMLGLKGWMEMHTALLTLENEEITSNRYGKATGDYLKVHLQHFHRSGDEILFDSRFQ